MNGRFSTFTALLLFFQVQDLIPVNNKHEGNKNKATVNRPITHLIVIVSSECAWKCH